LKLTLPLIVRVIVINILDIRVVIVMKVFVVMTLVIISAVFGLAHRRKPVFLNLAGNNPQIQLC
jgi:hypothetical protein